MISLALCMKQRRSRPIPLPESLAAAVYPPHTIAAHFFHCPFRKQSGEGAKNDLCKSHFLLLIIINDSFMEAACGCLSRKQAEKAAH